jgi:ABC-type multidrug transport system ATPase subunit
MSAPSPSIPAVELTGVSRLYGGFAALRDVSLRVHPGASVLLLGENGAGKSTLLRLLAGLLSPTSGSIVLFGDEPRAQRHRLALMSHASMLYDELTGLENLEYFASLHADEHAQTLNPQQALRDVGLDPALPRRVSDYSQGMRQRTSLACTLMLQPDLLLLDEPFSNLDADSARAMMAHLRAWLASPSASGVARTLILTTHQAELARPLASSIVTLNAGRVATLHTTGDAA